MSVSLLLGCEHRRSRRGLVRGGAPRPPLATARIHRVGRAGQRFMLQQTPVARVVPRLEEWLRRWPTPADLAAVPSGESVRAWDRLGYPRRALAPHGAAVAIVERHDGQVPDDVGALLDLPGVAPYGRPAARVRVRRAHARRRHQCPAGDGPRGRRPRRSRSGAAPARILRRWNRCCPRIRRGPAWSRRTGARPDRLRGTSSPRCDDCPIAASCAWRAAGYPRCAGPRGRYQSAMRVRPPGRGSDPATNSRPATSRFRGSRSASSGRTAGQFDGALTGLVDDGLAEPVALSSTLPGDVRSRRCRRAEAHRPRTPTIASPPRAPRRSPVSLGITGMFHAAPPRQTLSPGRPGCLSISTAPTFASSRSTPMARSSRSGNLLERGTTDIGSGTRSPT